MSITVGRREFVNRMRDMNNAAKESTSASGNGQPSVELTLSSATGAGNGSAATAADALPSHPEFLNRELSWLEFNRRVLHEASDERTPLLERVKFLEIFTSNLDEFYMKRVGGLRRQINVGVVSHTQDGLTPYQQMVAIRKTVVPMLKEQAEIFTNKVRPALVGHGIQLLEWADVPPEQR